MPSLINLYNLNLLAKGGPVMFILLGFSILALFIIILKLIQFSIVRVSNTNALDKIIGEDIPSLNKTRNSESPLALAVRT